MSRRKAAKKRVVLPDHVFGEESITKFINRMMVSGKRRISEKIVYGALSIVVETEFGGREEFTCSEDYLGSKDSIREKAYKIFRESLDAVTPNVEVRSRRVGGATFQVPVEVRATRKSALAMRWLIESAKKRGEKTMALRLAGEMKDALAGRGSAVKKRDEVHNMAKANQAFAHYRW